MCFRVLKAQPLSLVKLCVLGRRLKTNAKCIYEISKNTSHGFSFWLKNNFFFLHHIRLF